MTAMLRSWPIPLHHGHGPAPTQEDIDARESLEQSIRIAIPKTTLGGAMRLFREQSNVNGINY